MSEAVAQPWSLRVVATSRGAYGSECEMSEAVAGMRDIRKRAGTQDVSVREHEDSCSVE